MSACHLPQRIHPASRIAIAAHNPHLLRLVEAEVSLDMVCYVALQATQAIRVDDGDSTVASESTSLLPLVGGDELSAASKELASLQRFIWQLIKACNVQVGTLMTTLIYMERLRIRLSPRNKGINCSRHKIFLAILIVAAKYLNDSSPKNSHWASYARLVDVQQVTVLEREILTLLDYDLRFDELEVCTYFAPFMSTAAHIAHTRSLAVDKVTQARRTRILAQKVMREASSGRAHGLASAAIRNSSANLERATLAVPNLMRSRYNSSTSMKTSQSCGSSHSSASSEMGSLVDDTGSSSSGSSSGWLSTDSDSDFDDHDARICLSGHSEWTGTSESGYSNWKPFTLRPFPARPDKCSHKHEQIPSDTSICTVVVESPVTTASQRPINAVHGKRTLSGTSNCKKKDAHLIPSSTMPSIARIGGISSSFLSKVWGAAKGGQNVDIDGESNASNRHSQTAFRRLVLAHSKSGTLKANSAIES